MCNSDTKINNMLLWILADKIIDWKINKRNKSIWDL